MMLTFTLDAALVIQVLVSTVLPLLVGLVTKTVTSGGVKALLLAALALLTSMLTELGETIAAGTTYDVGVGLLLAVPTFLIAVGMHYGIWKPTGTSTRAQQLFDRNTVVVHESKPAELAPSRSSLPNPMRARVDLEQVAVDDVLDVASQDRYPLHGN